jgi:hypothetical protein
MKTHEQSTRDQLVELMQEIHAAMHAGHHSSLKEKMLEFRSSKKAI